MAKDKRYAHSDPKCLVAELQDHETTANAEQSGLFASKSQVEMVDDVENLSSNASSKGRESWRPRGIKAVRTPETTPQLII